jgi:hypothetical protein
MAKGLPKGTPQPQPDGVTADTNASQPVGQLAMDFRKPLDYIHDFHGALQASVAAAGGVVKVADRMGKSHSEISLKIRREQDGHGTIQKATFDLAGEVASMGHPARLAFITELNRRWGLKPPVPIHEPSTEEKLRLIVGRLIGTPAGEAILKDAAEANGFDSNIFRR